MILSLVVMVLVSTILLGINQASALSPIIAHWTFNNGNTAIAKDVSGNGNDGNIIGATVVIGKSGKALSFDGADDVVSVPNSPSLNFGSNGNFSISLWMKSTQSGQGNVGSGWLVDHRRNNDGVYQGYSILDNAGIIRAEIRDQSGNNKAVLSTINVNDGNYHNIVFAVNRANQIERLYVDGHLNSSASIAKVGSIDTSFNLNLGGTTAPDTLVNFFNGTIDEVTIWNEPLKAAKIHSLFSLGH